MNMHSIQNEADYKAALKIVSALVDVDPQRGTLEADRLEALGFLVEAYESGLAKSMLQGGNLESAMGHDETDSLPRMNRPTGALKFIVGGR